MRINKTKKTTKTFIVIIAIILILTVAGVFFAFKLLLHNEAATKTKINYTPPTSEQVKNGTDIKKESIQNQQTNTNLSNTSDTQASQNLSNVTILMTYANQNPGTYAIRFQIDKDVNQGTCTMTLSQQGKQLHYSADVQLNSNVASCKGFDIPIDSDHLTTGTWGVKLEFKNSSYTGSSNATIQVK